MASIFTLLLTCLLLLALACGDDSDANVDDGGDGDTPDAGMGPGAAPDPLPELGLTTNATLAPVSTPADTPDDRFPLEPEDRASMLEDGLGDEMGADGEPYLTRVMGDADTPPPGEGRELIARFAHLPDLQLTDDESPARAVNFDNATLFAGAFRPQESYLCHMTNAMVRTLNEVHADHPLDFVLLGGDNADNAQSNEVDWVLQILGGADEVECDSADDTDLVEGPDNDGKDPFEAPGLDVPFYWVTGNHDILAQGTAPLSEEYMTAVVGELPVEGFACRDFSIEGGPMTMEGPVPADPDRFFLSREALMERVAGHDDGHGVGDDQVESGKAIYTVDVEGTPLRLLVLDTAAETGAAEGVIHQADIDAAIGPALDQAVENGKWVILASHHAVSSLGNGGGFMGVVQEDAVTQEDWLALIGSYPNVLFSMVGHSHVNRVRALGDGHQFWELTTSALADYPHQARIVEIWDQDNGWVMLRATQVDFDVTDDPIAAEGRRRGVMDFVSGWNPDGSGELEDRNVELWIEEPDL